MLFSILSKTFAYTSRSCYRLGALVWPLPLLSAAISLITHTLSLHHTCLGRLHLHWEFSWLSRRHNVLARCDLQWQRIHHRVHLPVSQTVPRCRSIEVLEDEIVIVSLCSAYLWRTCRCVVLPSAVIVIGHSMASKGWILGVLWP